MRDEGVLLQTAACIGEHDDEAAAILIPLGDGLAWNQRTRARGEHTERDEAPSQTARTDGTHEHAKEEERMCA